MNTPNEQLVHDQLSTLAKKWEKNEELSSADISRGISQFLCRYVFDAAPTGKHATHLILGAINEAIEAKISAEAPEDLSWDPETMD